MSTLFKAPTAQSKMDAGSVAMRRMQEIAQTLYDTTPGLQGGKLYPK